MIWHPPAPEVMPPLQGGYPRPWLSGGLVLLLAGLVLRSPWLLTLGWLILGVGLLAKAWSRLAPVRLRFERRLDQDRLFAGESVTLTLGLDNAKLLPLPWARLSDGVPKGLEYGGAPVEPAETPGHLALVQLAVLGPYGRMRWRYRLHCPRRGHYRFGPARLSTGDPFGLFETRRQAPDHARLVVYPAVRPLPALGLPAGDPFGGRRARQALVRDPLRSAGVREMQPGDAMRDVHWKASARQPDGSLMVKVHQPTSRPSLMLVLDIGTFAQAWQGVDPEVQERLVAVAASIAHHAASEGLALGLVANGVVPGRGRRIRVPISGATRALPRILEALAAVTPYVHGSSERLLDLESRRAAWGSTLVMISALVKPDMVQTLIRIADSGRRTVLVSLDPRAEPLRRLPASLQVFQLDAAGIDHALAAPESVRRDKP